MGEFQCPPERESGRGWEIAIEFLSRSENRTCAASGFTHKLFHTQTVSCGKISLHARYRVHTKLSSIFTLLTGASEYHSSKDFAGIDLHPPPFLFTPHWAIPKQWRENYNLGARFHTHTLSPAQMEDGRQTICFRKPCQSGRAAKLRACCSPPLAC